MERKRYVKGIKAFFCTMLFVVLSTVIIWAGDWEKQEDGGVKYKQDDGTYLVNTWLQENGAWYFFDENGRMAVNCDVEGYQLGADGAEMSGAAAITSQYAQLIVPAAAETEVTYVLNKNTKKFHNPGCSSVGSIAEKNRLDSGESRDAVMAQGYVPCKRCNP